MAAEKSVHWIIPRHHLCLSLKAVHSSKDQTHWSPNCKYNQWSHCNQAVASCNLIWRCFAPTSIQHDIFVGWNSKFEHKFQSHTIGTNYQCREQNWWSVFESVTFAAYKCGDYTSKHWVQLPYYGVGQVSTRFNLFKLCACVHCLQFKVHLRPREGGRDGPSGHHRHVGPDQPHQEADLCRLRHHEPSEQGHRIEG